MCRQSLPSLARVARAPTEAPRLCGEASASPPSASYSAASSRAIGRAFSERPRRTPGGIADVCCHHRATPLRGCPGVLPMPPVRRRAGCPSRKRPINVGWGASRGRPCKQSSLSTYVRVVLWCGGLTGVTAVGPYSNALTLGGSSLVTLQTGAMPPRPSPQAGADGAPADRPAEMTDDASWQAAYFQATAGSDDESSGGTGTPPPSLVPGGSTGTPPPPSVPIDIGLAPVGIDPLVMRPRVSQHYIQSWREHHGVPPYSLSFPGNRTGITGILQPVDTHMHSRLREIYADTLDVSPAADTPSSDEEAPSAEADTLPSVSATVRTRCLECALRRWRRACDLAHRGAG